MNSLAVMLCVAVAAVSAQYHHSAPSHDYHQGGSSYGKGHGAATSFQSFHLESSGHDAGYNKPSYGHGSAPSYNKPSYSHGSSYGSHGPSHGSSYGSHGSSYGSHSPSYGSHGSSYSSHGPSYNHGSSYKSSY